MQVHRLDAAWEATFAPYDRPTYQLVLSQLEPDDILFDIGAGDLRLTRQMAQIVKKVYAVEINARILAQAYTSPEPLPDNVLIICADARDLDIPCDVTTGVLMMRHCTYFRLYAEKLVRAGAHRLITNARWRMGVEVMNLRSQRKFFSNIGMGWYACQCGSTGFKEGPAEYWSDEMDGMIHEVYNCPRCQKERTEH